MKLFASARSNNSGVSGTTTVETLIGRQTEIHGDIRFAGGLHVDGTIKGSVTGAADKAASLSISEFGVIEGDVRVSTVIINGTVIGDVRTSERLVLNSKARVNGNVYYKVLQMEPGAMINGQLVSEGPEQAALAGPKVIEAHLETGSFDLNAGGHGNAR